MTKLQTIASLSVFTLFSVVGLQNCAAGLEFSAKSEETAKSSPSATEELAKEPAYVEPGYVAPGGTCAANVGQSCVKIEEGPKMAGCAPDETCLSFRGEYYNGNTTCDRNKFSGSNSIFEVFEEAGKVWLRRSPQPIELVSTLDKAFLCKKTSSFGAQRKDGVCNRSTSSSTLYIVGNGCFHQNATESAGTVGCDGSCI